MSPPSSADLTSIGTGYHEDPAASMSLRADADVNVDMIVQNGVWLTSVLVPDPDTVARPMARAEAIAFDHGPDSAATRPA